MTDRQRGLFVVFEGLDGSGKTTQAGLLLEALYKFFPLPRLTWEPYRIGTVPRDPYEAALYFAQDRLEHYRTDIDWNLKHGQPVICDRYVLSSLAYQVADGAPLEWVREINKYAPEPDLTVFIQMKPGDCADRINKREKRMPTRDELMRLGRVATQYTHRVAELPADKILIVDGRQDKDAIHARILARVKEMTG